MRTIKRILKHACRLLVLRPGVGKKRAEVFYTATSERIARVNLTAQMDVEILKPVMNAQRSAKKETKKVS